MNKGSLIIFSGPSGSGKDTVLKELLKIMPELEFSISNVTRDMRVGEVEGEKYHFISREEFRKMIDENALLEYNVYCENYYGTPKAPVEKCIASGGEIILEIDVNGADNVRKVCKDCYSVFVAPPSFEVLKQRLIGRGTETQEVINKRLKQAEYELSRADEYDYILINDDLDTAVHNFADIIKAERMKISRNADTLAKIQK